MYVVGVEVLFVDVDVDVTGVCMSMGVDGLFV